MSTPVSKPSLVKVLCEPCLKDKDPDCILCKGASFYYWNPETLECFDPQLLPIQVEDENGETITVVRNLQPKEKSLELSVMLRFIELWVLEDPVRKWKLWVDDNGWHSSVWFNRYKKSGSDCTEDSLEKCVASSYDKVVDATQSRSS